MIGVFVTNDDAMGSITQQHAPPKVANDLTSRISNLFLLQSINNPSMSADADAVDVCFVLLVVAG